MTPTFYKYQGAGNDFLIADNREGGIVLTPERISALCDRRYGIGADGVMLLERAEGPYDYRMVYYNSDGSGGMMCGNGGRCIVAFADFCGIGSHRFVAADGPHEAQILRREGLTLTVRLRMRDVAETVTVDEEDVHGTFLDTGTRHLVVPVTGLAGYDVEGEGRRLRRHPAFAPQGVNVNFIEPQGGVLHVRTYEKGVEAETYACGTGITAAAITYARRAAVTGRPVTVPVQALRDALTVEFTPTAAGAADVWLTGPATRVAKIEPQ